MSEFEPELRDRPPWAMEEMIEAQRNLPDLIARGSALRVTAEMIRQAALSGEQVLVCGCGTSEHAARAIAAILRETQPNCTVLARDSFEVTLAPPDRGLLIAISHEGATAATQAAVSKSIGAGARVLLITANPGAAPEFSQAAGTPLRDQSWCHTVAYMSPILTCALGAGLEPAAARELIEQELGERERRQADASALGECERLLIVGSGVDQITASELALKIEEAAHLPCTPLSVEKVLHGHLPAADASTGLVLVRFDSSAAEQRDARATTVAAAVAVLQMPTVELARPGLQSTAAALIAGAVALQMLTLELSMVLGTNPDLIRREEPLYRTVATVGRAG